jgi:transcriptional regulator with XRE-family HTH domain
MNFSENLRDAIEYSGLGQKELAYKAKIPLSSIENYLRENASIPSVDKAVRIAQILGVTVEYLVTGKNPPADDFTLVNPENRTLLQYLKKLPKNKQRIVIQNALNLVDILSQPNRTAGI